MENQNSHRMPPVMRVFLSSTFADMERERSYFNEVLSPDISRLCAGRGVSFFSVDLRWGITQEDQINGQVLPICLSEIDKCRPYFIGILGSRYGSVMETVPDKLAQSIPWLQGREGKSITELEMLYAVLEHQPAAANCAFYFRDEALSAQWYGEQEPEPRLQALKDRIRRETSVPGSDYDSLEAFGQKVMADIRLWLDREFPVPERVAQVRRQWYDAELLRNYMPVPGNDRFLNSYLRDSHRSLLFYGDGGRGKTTFLTAWEPEQGEKILVNCGSDDTFLSWTAVVRHIALELARLDGVPAGEALKGLFVREDGAMSRQEQEELRRRFPEWLRRRKGTQQVYVVINDLNLLSDEDGQLLSWLPDARTGNVQFIGSTNREEMVRNAEALNWNCHELPLFPVEKAGSFLERYLSTYGKSLSPVQLQTLLTSPAAVYPGQLRAMADFLINCGRFHNLDALIEELSREATPYACIYRYFAGRGTPEEAQALRCVLGLLRCARISLNEQLCYRLCGELTGITAMGWAKIRSVFEQFGLVGGDYWTMRNKELKRFTDELLGQTEQERLHLRLGDAMLEELMDEAGERNDTACAGAALYHFARCAQPERLLRALREHRVLRSLAVSDRRGLREAWMWLFLNTDTDISQALTELLERYCAPGEDRGIAEGLASVMTDLRLTRGTPRFGLAPQGDLTPGMGIVSPEFMELYGSLSDLRRERKYRKLLEEIHRVLEQDREYTPSERCCLLSLKAECEQTLEHFSALLQTANEYYLQSLRGEGLPDMCRALSFRAEALYELDRFDETREVVDTVRSFALRDGDLYRYLSMEGLKGLCLHRQGESEEALGCLDRLLGYWNRLGDTLSAAYTTLKKCAVLADMDRDRQAWETAEAMYEALPDTEAFRSIRLTTLAKIGRYAMNVGKGSRAEHCLLEAMEGAKALGQEATLYAARHSLILLYQRTDRFVPASLLYEEQLELYWQRGEYNRVLNTLNSALQNLLANKYGPMARDLERKWEARFAGLPGGARLFRRGMERAVADERKLDRLGEELTMAKSEEDTLKTARAHEALARELGTADLSKSVSNLELAVQLYRQAGADDAAEGCAEFSVSLLFRKGRLRDEGMYSRVMALVTSRELARLAEIWQTLGKIMETGKDMDGVRSLVEELTELVRVLPDTVLSCLMDILSVVVICCPMQTLLDLVEAMPEKTRRTFLPGMEDTMLRDSQRDIDDMTKDHASPRTAGRLAYYEKCIRVMDELGLPGVAPISGNLALIFRRRKEQEKTLYYHNLSRERYQQQGRIRDQLIETMNLATACEQFGDPQKAIELLRQGLRDATRAEERGMAAAIAGNLASYLVRRSNIKDRDEIQRCFTIEESYFRSSGAQRELAISLINQLIYLRSEPKHLWEDKLREVGQIIRENRFREFEQVLNRLEWMAQQSEEEQKLDASQVRQILVAVLGQTGRFRLDELTLEEGRFHGECSLAEDDRAGIQMLHLYLDPASPNRLDAVFLFCPAAAQTGAAQTLQTYIHWWNNQDSYKLRLYESQMVLQGECLIMAPDLQGLIGRFGRYLQLWGADVQAASAIAAGGQEMSAYQGHKLQVFTEGQ